MNAMKNTQSTLTVRIRGRAVELVCATCQFTLTLPLRADLPSDCPRCGASWCEELLEVRAAGYLRAVPVEVNANLKPGAAARAAAHA